METTPQFVRRGKILEKPFLAGKVIELDDTVAVGGVGEVKTKDFRVFLGLLEAITRQFVRRLGLDDRNGKITSVPEQVVCSLLRPAFGPVAGNDDPAIREVALLGDKMRLVIPASFGKLGNDVLATGIGLVYDAGALDNAGWALKDPSILPQRARGEMVRKGVRPPRTGL